MSGLLPPLPGDNAAPTFTCERSGNDDDDPLFLQVKEAQASVLEAHVRFRLPFDDHGRRVVVGQRLIQGSPDIFLGWGTLDHRHFYVRQLADMKGGVDMIEGNREGLAGFKEYCRLCGWALALAHAKSGDPALKIGRAHVLNSSHIPLSRMPSSA